MRSAGRGASSLVASEALSEGPEEIFRPAIRGVATTGWLWIPAAFYLERRYEFVSGGASVLEIARDPLTWLLPALALPFLPIAVIAAATDVALVDLFNPVFLVRAIMRVGGDYWRTVAAVSAMVLVGATWSLVVGKVAGEGGLASFVRDTLVNLVLLASARAIGALLYLRGDAVGWGDETQYQVPVLGPTPPTP